jgi:hypothetical protein
MFGDSISPRNAQIDSTLSDEGRDIRSGEEDEGNRQILNKRNIKS